MKKDSDKNQITLVETSLQQSFNGITAKQLASDFAEVELKRADWLVSAVMFGIKCIAAKPQAKQGDFSAFLAKAIGDKDGKSLATAQRYMGLACQVIAQFANPNPENEIGARVLEYFSVVGNDNPRAFFASQGEAVDTLKYILQGFSLRGLTKALQGIDFALAAEDNRQKKLDGGLPQTSKPQDFFDLLDRDIFSIDEKIKSRELARLPKDKVLAYADALVERGERLRAAVENASEE